MNNIDCFIDYLKQPEFYKLHLASSANLYYRLIREDEKVVDFIDLVAKEKIGEKVLEKIKFYAEIKTEEGFSNPNNDIVATLLFVLYQANNALFFEYQKEIEQVLSNMKNGFYQKIFLLLFNEDRDIKEYCENILYMEEEE